ncbi:MAG: Cu(I)/Ag(I) efflux system membrane fusion protein [Chlamydiales bacterium]|jgi:Cu(I)/Ag(I) efflux system membrane fusion protein
MKNKGLFLGILFLLLTVSGGVYFNFFRDESTLHKHDESNTIWTCAMHPQIQMPYAGQCPICGMELIPLKNEEGAGKGEVSLILSDRARKLAELETALVKRRRVHLDVRMYGKIDFDETRIVHITARNSGRIERLFLDYTGVAVEKGDHMVEIYSPELLTAQQELIQAVQSLKNINPDASKFLKKNLADNLNSSRKKLQLWGLSNEQIEGIEGSGEPKEVLTIYAPTSGIVIHKDAIEGKYVDEGTKIYTIANLKELWLILDAYESDLSALRHGQDVFFTAEAFPGKTFRGSISFIDSVLDEARRSVKVRVNVQNGNNLLKPGMFVRARVKPLVSDSGGIISSNLEGKWIGRMHSQIVQDEPGKCPICGMDLVKAESLGYVSLEEENGKLPLTIPATSPLITGKRAIVFVEDITPLGSYSAREVLLGPRAEDYYVVYDGLEEGERVVISGNFKIDSASQIRAKPSMMMPMGGKSIMKGHGHH